MRERSESESRYSYAGHPTGWAAVAKTIRDKDEDKVKDCKEDIDTLLVFTGLFSAVLTAFVIESYGDLSPDKMDTVIQLLGQISNQTSVYATANGQINATITSSQGLSHVAASFVPPKDAVRINQLWFASLVIALLTASFGILVKQWLREYLAVEYTPPHERLGARQFRHPGLAYWKVFEIAGILPLLLQTSLGLFFVGLCVFTFSANPGVGKTSTALVAGWALLLFCTTAAPIVSSRCPYKTSPFKDIITILRCRFGHRLRQILETIFPILPRSDTLEEKEAVQQNMDEIQVLVEADAVLLDDEQLGTTIYESLMQVQASPEKIIPFAIDVINNRLKGSIRVPQPPLVITPDLHQLSKRGWIAVTNIVAGTIAHGIEVSKASSEHTHWQWFGDAIRLLLSKSQYPLTENACSILIRSLRKDTFDHFLNALVSLSTTPDRAMTVSRLHSILGHLSTRLCELLRDHQLNAEQVIKFVLHTTPLETVSMIASPLRSTLNLRLLSPSVWAFAQDTVGNVVLEHSNLPTQEDRSIGPWLQDAVHILLSTSQYLLTPTAVKALARWIRAGPAVDRRRTSPQFNVVRFCWVIVQLHAELENQSDFVPHWQRFYMQCAKAMRWFRENRYPLLPKQERQETRRLAKQCLDQLISLGLADMDLEQDDPLAELDTFLPDDIFREVVMFSPFDRADTDDTEHNESSNALSSIDDEGLLEGLKNFMDIFEELEWREMIAT